MPIELTSTEKIRLDRELDKHPDHLRLVWKNIIVNYSFDEKTQKFIKDKNNDNN